MQLKGKLMERQVGPAVQEDFPKHLDVWVYSQHTFYLSFGGNTYGQAQALQYSTHPSDCGDQGICCNHVSI